MAEVIICRVCGEANPLSASSCSRCKLTLQGVEPDKVTPVRVVRGREGGDWGGVVAIGLFLVLLVVVAWVGWTMASVGAKRELSAVQVTQLYTMGNFWLLAVIGVAALGILYVVSVRR